MMNTTQRALLTLLAALALTVTTTGCDAEDGPTTTLVTGANCGCGDAVCGFDLCGNSCGTCTGVNMELCSAGQCVDSTSCSDELVGFSLTAEAAYNRVAGGKQLLYYVASTGDGDPPFEKIVIEVDHEAFFGDAEVQTGVFDLAAQDPNNCDFCVRGYSYCNQDDCFNKYAIESGEVEIVASGQPGQPFVGRFRGLKLREVLFEGGNYLEHPNPKTFCMGDFHFDAEVPELKEAEGNCLEEGTGNELGDNIADFTLTNCLGEEINLHSRCGLHNAVWIVATAGWCGACEQFVPVVAEEQRNRGDALDIMIVIGETGSGGAPDLAYCYDYATEKGVNPRQVFIDNGGQSWGVTFQNVSTYGSGIGLPWSAILEGGSMEYLWNSSVGEGGVIENVNAALN